MPYGFFLAEKKQPTAKEKKKAMWLKASKERKAGK